MTRGHDQHFPSWHTLFYHSPLIPPDRLDGHGRQSERGRSERVRDTGERETHLCHRRQRSGLRVDSLSVSTSYPRTHLLVVGICETSQTSRTHGIDVEDDVCGWRGRGAAASFIGVPLYVKFMISDL